MRRIVSFALLAGSLSACGSSSNEMSGGAFDTGGSGSPGGGGSGAGGAGGYGGHQGTDGGGYAAGAAGMGGNVYDAAVPPAADAGQKSDAAEAGPNADDAGACAKLDPTKPLVLYQSADDSNSMASPVLARKLILAGAKLPPGLARTYEFFNYYRFGYEPADPGHVRVVPQIRPAKEAGEYTLQIALQAEPAKKPRRQMNMTLVVDTSGSMGAGGRIERERAVLKAIIGQMRQGDLVSMVTWSTAQVALFDGHVVSGPNDPQLLQAVDGLDANGGTDFNSGLTKGYEMAKKHYQKELMNRVVITSDGEANVGVTQADVIGQSSHTADDEGIYLVGVNVGDLAGDNLMNVVTDLGRGASVFVDTEAEAAFMFGERFDETMEIAARGVRLELTLPWYMTMKTFSGEKSSTNPKEVDPQHLAPGDAMVFYATYLPCSPALFDQSHTITAKATWETPLGHEKREDSATSTLGALLATPAPHLAKGRAVYFYAKALERAPALPTADAKKLVEEAAAEIAAANPGQKDPELGEMAELIAKFKKGF